MNPGRRIHGALADIKESSMSEIPCCPDGACGSKHSVSRRRFFTVSAGTAAGLMLASRAAAAAQLGVSEDDLVLVPADKDLSADWIRSLYKRGTPSAYTGGDLRYIGMPVGGGCTGQLYLGGDGRLWNWDIFNTPARGTSDITYADPREPSSPFKQGFALRTTAGAVLATAAWTPTASTTCASPASTPSAGWTMKPTAWR